MQVTLLLLVAYFAGMAVGHLIGYTRGFRAAKSVVDVHQHYNDSGYLSIPYRDKR